MASSVQRSQLVACLVALFFLATNEAFCQAPRGDQAKTPEKMVRLIALPESNVDRDDVKDTLQELRGEIVRTISTPSGGTAYVIQVPATGEDDAQNRVRRSDKFKSIQVSRKGTIKQTKSDSLVPDDPLFKSQWNLMRMGYPAAYKFEASTVKVAVIDSGTQRVSDLDKVLDSGRNLVERFKTKTGDSAIANSGPSDGGHGTLVAGCVAAINGNRLLLSSPAPNARIIPYNVFDVKVEDGKAELDASDEDILAAMTAAKDAGAKIVNISIGSSDPTKFGTYMDKSKNAAFHDFAKQLYDAGIIVVLSAGNEAFHDTNPRVEYLTVVSALERDNTLVKPGRNGSDWGSNWGSSVTLSAPGNDVLLLNRFGRTELNGGTSFAAPYVSGVLAFVWGVYPRLSHRELLHLIRTTALKPSGADYTEEFGFGIPNAFRAVKEMSGDFAAEQRQLRNSIRQAISN